MIGVSGGVAATVGFLNPPTDVLYQMGGTALIGKMLIAYSSCSLIITRVTSLFHV